MRGIQDISGRVDENRQDNLPLAVIYGNRAALGNEELQRQ